MLAAHWLMSPLIVILLADGDADGLDIELTKVQHPCIKLQDNINFMPNDTCPVFWHLITPAIERAK